MTSKVSYDIIFEFYSINLLFNQNFKVDLFVKIHDCTALPTFV